MPRFSLLLITTFIVVANTFATYDDLLPHKYENPTNNELGEHNAAFYHETIIGNIKKGQKYDTLSPEESKKRLTILLGMMDLNSNGYIDRHELKTWILRSLRKLSEEEAAKRFDEIDQDYNGKVTWKEYFKDFYFMKNDNQKKELDFDSYEKEHKNIGEDKEMFKEADLNNDGVLELEEFVLFHNPEEHPQMFPIFLEHTLSEKDTNHDGQINFTEFIGKPAEHHDREWLLIEKEHFDEYDENKDNVLTGNEILSWVVPSNNVAKDEVDHLFDYTDEDNDDRLSFREIVNNHNIFVGSEATNYGHQLYNIQHFSDEL